MLCAMEMGSSRKANCRDKMHSLTSMVIMIKGDLHLDSRRENGEHCIHGYPAMPQ